RSGQVRRRLLSPAWRLRGELTGSRIAALPGRHGRDSPLRPMPAASVPPFAGPWGPAIRRASFYQRKVLRLQDFLQLSRYETGVASVSRRTSFTASTASAEAISSAN